MTWFKVCDTFHSHPKTLEASDAALSLWVRAGSWCGQQLSDGLVPHRWAHRNGSPEAAQELIELGLWIKDGADYRFHDWEDNNPTREQVTTRREADRLRKRSVRSDGAADSAQTAAGIPVGTGSSSRKSNSARPGIHAASTRTPPKLSDLCDLHAQDRKTCPHCKWDAA